MTVVEITKKSNRNTQVKKLNNKWAYLSKRLITRYMKYIAHLTRISDNNYDKKILYVLNITVISMMSINIISSLNL